MKIKFLKRVVAFLVFITVAFVPLIASAHDAFYMQALFSLNDGGIRVSVVEDKASFFNAENKHIEAQNGDFTQYMYSYGKIIIPNDVNNYPSGTVNGQSAMLFTFPSHEIKVGSYKNNAGAADANQAYLIQQTLAPGLNEALSILNCNQSYKSIEDLVEMASKLAAESSSITSTDRNGTVHTFSVKYGQVITSGENKHVWPTDPNTGSPYTVNVGGNKVPWDPITTARAEDYVVITDLTTGAQYEFVYRLLKGYKNEYKLDGTKNELHTKNGSGYGADAEYITWPQLIYQAAQYYYRYGWTTTYEEMVKPGIMEEMVASLFQSLFTFLRNMLGLYSDSELIFNSGIRGSQAWAWGALSKDWVEKTNIFFSLFQALAWALIVFSIIKLIMQRNVATINTTVRVNMYESIQNLLVTAFLLANLYPFMQLIFILNAKLVNVLSAVAPNVDNLAGLNSYSTFLGGILMQLFYFVVNVYLNIVYVMRAITIAVLISTAPLFIYTLSLGGQWRSLFTKWLREFICNVFMQSFHAFILGFFLTIQTGARGIEGLVVTGSLIPLTKWFKAIIMGENGGFAGAAGLGAVQKGVDMTAKFASGLNESRKNSRAEKTGSTSSGGSSREHDANNSAVNPEGEAIQVQTRQAHASRTVPLEKTDSKFGRPDYDSSMPISNDAEYRTSLHKNDAAIGNNSESLRTSQSDAKLGGKPEALMTSQSDVKLGNKSDSLKAFPDDAKQGGKLNAIKTSLREAAPARKAYKTMAGSFAKMAVAGTVALATGETSLLNESVRGGVRDSREAFNDLKSFAKDYISSDNRKNQVKNIDEHYKNRLDANGNINPSFEPMDSEVSSKTLKNTDIEVERDGAILMNEGIRGMYTHGNEGKESTEVVYDMSKLDNTDKDNLRSIAQIYQLSKSEDVNEDERKNMTKHLREQGVEGVGYKNGNLSVTYNQAGAEKLGFKHARMDDKTKNIIETKRYNQPTKTARTYEIKPYAYSSPEPVNGRESV